MRPPYMCYYDNDDDDRNVYGNADHTDDKLRSVSLAQRTNESS